VLLFAELAEAGEIARAFGHDIRPVARAARHELAGNRRCLSPPYGYSGFVVMAGEAA
jgi:hypothetical protein